MNGFPNKKLLKHLWISSLGLNKPNPFGTGKEGALSAIKRLGYVQIDTIHVIERAHHHILQARVEDYQTHYLHELQSVDKSVFEFWTHALSYIPTEYYPHSIRLMRDHTKHPSRWYQGVKESHLKSLLRRIDREGPISMRHIDEEKEEKDHEWASRKPSKRALEFLFYAGKLVVSKREGMLKHYELPMRHFGWKSAPKPPSETETLEFRIDRALDAQGAITVSSATHLESSETRHSFSKLIQKRVKKGELRAFDIEDLKDTFFAREMDLAKKVVIDPNFVRILSPFDPLVIQRKRTKSLFDFDYVLECYVPKPKRKFGYFVLPILVGDEFKARIDLKADREKKKLLIQSWSWEKTAHDKRMLRALIESELDRFHNFQFGVQNSSTPSRRKV